MKKVEITIEVEVPHDAKCVALAENGVPWSSSSALEKFESKYLDGGKWFSEDRVPCTVANWRETLTEVE